MEPIRFEATWTREDAVRYAMEGKILNWRFLLWAIACLVLGAAALIIQFTMGSDIYILAIGIAGIVIPLAFVIMTVNGARTGYDKRPNAGHPVHYEIAREGIKRESETGTVVLASGQIHAIAFMKRFIAIAISPREAYVVPRRCIPEGLEARAEEILRELEKKD